MAKIQNEDSREKEIRDEPSGNEADAGVPLERKETGEQKETLDGSEISVGEELKKKIEELDLDATAKQQAVASAQTIKSLKDEEKIQHLLEIAKKKGVVYAVAVAKNMDDAFLLDVLHDVLAKEGLYKKFKE